MSDDDLRLWIEKLSSEHDRSVFSCGNDALDRYLKQQASQDARSKAGVTFVLVNETRNIAGYYTLSATSIPATDIPQNIIKKFKLPKYPSLPATLIGRLARDISFRGQNIGTILLIDALKRSLRSSSEVASVATVVDAKDEHAHQFYEKFGFEAFAETKTRLFIPMETVLQTLGS